MPAKGQMLVDLSSSMSLLSEKGEVGQNHFRWGSIKTFCYFAFTFSSTSCTFDMFSSVMDNVRFLDFIIVEMTVGITYMVMDFFIKQYTRKLDFLQSLNPLLKGIVYGSMLQSGIFALLHASDIADSFEYAAMVISRPKVCVSKSEDYCLERKIININCQKGVITPMNITMIHVTYLKYFSASGVTTTKLFSTAIIWICNFFFTTVTDETLLLISKISFFWRTLSMCILAAIISLTSSNLASAVIGEMMSLNSPPSYLRSVEMVTYIYGIGFIGVYDFQLISPYTMVDNAVIIFSILFTVMGVIRSLIMGVLFKIMSKCISVEKKVDHHYLLYAIFPMAADYLSAHKFFILVVYGNIIVGTLGYLSTTTLCISKLLHREFRSLKIIYIVGILCFTGFAASLPFAMRNYYSPPSEVIGLSKGMSATTVFVGGFKAALIMWMYGVKRFSTDIHFWLGFKPTKYWLFCWSMLPIVLLGIFTYYIIDISHLSVSNGLAMAFVYIGVIVLVVEIFQIRTIAKCMMANHFVNAFKTSRNYGPPDRDDREKRRHFSETLRLRKCNHNCKVLDDTYDCNHMPLMPRSRSSIALSELDIDSSDELLNIYEALGSKKDFRASTAAVETFISEE